MTVFFIVLLFLMMVKHDQNINKLTEEVTALKRQVRKLQ
jgi:polyhydroxyalkanoate synthesis regulator phasin